MLVYVLVCISLSIYIFVPTLQQIIILTVQLPIYNDKHFTYLDLSLTEKAR